MKFGIGVAVLLLVAGITQGQTTKEWKLNVEPYGLVKAGCNWYPGHVDFLDDEHLVISAPVAYTCDKSDRNKATDTRITVIDLQGQKLADIHRADVVQTINRPTGYVTACTGDRLELLSRDLQVVSSIAVPAGKFSGCYSELGISPSRTTIGIGNLVNPYSSFTEPRQASQSRR